MKEAYVVGLCGGSASGKTTVARYIIDRIKVPWVVILSLDSFYKPLTPEQHELASKLEYDFDSPSSIDLDLAIETLKNMKRGKTVKSVVYGANVIIVEGLLALYPKALRDLMDLKIFVDTDSDLRLCRRCDILSIDRVKRDISERGRELSSILIQYSRFVKPNFDKYIAPLVSVSDIVIPWNTYNNPAVDMISKLIKRSLESVLYNVTLEGICFEESDEISTKIQLIKQTNQVRALQTIIRDSTTEKLLFLNATRRLMKLCLIESLSLIDNSRHNSNYSYSNICTVSIMRAGEAFEDAANEILYDHSVGRILIRTNNETHEPEFHHLWLPHNIGRCSVLLLDAAIASGASAIMAIRILIDHDVSEEDIIMTSLIITPAGVQTILNAFPKVKIVSAAIDSHLNSNFHIIPGFGNFGMRYFGS